MYHTSDQHKDKTKGRQEPDYEGTNELVTYQSQRNPFSADPSLRSITTGVVAGEDVNVDKAKEVGEKVFCSMLGKNTHDHSFRRKDQVQTLPSNSAVRFSEGGIQVDSRYFLRGTLLLLQEDGMRILSYSSSLKCAATLELYSTPRFFRDKLTSQH